jgi:hypothetical protein
MHFGRNYPRSASELKYFPTLQINTIAVMIDENAMGTIFV